MSKDQDPPTIVLFRASRRKETELTAVFPLEPWDAERTQFTVYAPHEGHCGATLGWYFKTRPATESEYAPLLAELKRIGYDNLVIRKRWPVRR